MASSEPFGQRGRLLVAVVLFAALAGLMVWSGTLVYGSTMDTYPAAYHVGPDPDRYVGERVVLRGEVVDADPVVVAVVHPDGTTAFTVDDANDAIRNADRPHAVGDRIEVFGTLTDSSTLVAERSIARRPWEFQYMYAVSLLGGLWTAARFVRGWRFDRDRLAFVPREQPLSLRKRRRSDDRDRGRPRDERRTEPTRERADEPTTSRSGPGGVNGDA